MNWLAHLLLSEPQPAFRIGNILPDILPPGSLSHLPAEIQQGIKQHRQIDAFTDTHPAIRRSIHRVCPSFRRFGGILVDIFYDHFLARDWNKYSRKQLRDFVDEFYSSFGGFHNILPTATNTILDQVRSGDWLCSYGEISGVRDALNRVGLRLRKPVSLGNSVSDLKLHYNAFHSDFVEFFPDLQAHLNHRVTAMQKSISKDSKNII